MVLCPCAVGCFTWYLDFLGQSECQVHMTVGKCGLAPLVNPMRLSLLFFFFFFLRSRPALLSWLVPNRGPLAHSPFLQPSERWCSCGDRRDGKRVETLRFWTDMHKHTHQPPCCGFGECSMRIRRQSFFGFLCKIMLFIRLVVYQKEIKYVIDLSGANGHLAYAVVRAGHHYYTVLITEQITDNWDSRCNERSLDEPQVWYGTSWLDDWGQNT